MDYKITMNASKMWEEIKANTTLLIDIYYNDPVMFEFIMKLDETKMMMLRIVYILIVFLVIRSITRLCMDPFSIKLHKHIDELETKLSESDDAFQDAFYEKGELEKENLILKEKLAELEKQISSLESRYLCCRESAQNFLSVKPRD
jgi:hypothetical protein